MFEGQKFTAIGTTGLPVRGKKVVAVAPDKIMDYDGVYFLPAIKSNSGHGRDEGYFRVVYDKEPTVFKYKTHICGKATEFRATRLPEPDNYEDSESFVYDADGNHVFLDWIVATNPRGQERQLFTRHFRFIRV